MESPTNPTLTVIDIAAVSDIAHKKVIMEYMYMYIILYILLCVCRDALLWLIILS